MLTPMSSSRALPMDAFCPYDDGIINGSKTFAFWEKPFGFDSGEDGVYWAVVIEPAYAGSVLFIYGADPLPTEVFLSAGLNYGSITSRSRGAQFMQVLDKGGNVLLSAAGGECVYGPQECLRYIYDMNYSVVGFQQGRLDATCTTATMPDFTIPADVSINLDVVSLAEALPTFTALPLPTGPSRYVAGETLQTVGDPPNQDFTVDITLVGSPVEWDPNFCGSEGGSYCIGETVEFMVLAVDQLGGPVQTTFRRDIPASDFHFQHHSQWLPPTESSKNSSNNTCSTPRCMLLAGTPTHTWTSVGNGTYKGRSHELHFLHTEKMHGHLVVVGNGSTASVSTDNATNGTLVGRQSGYGSRLSDYNGNGGIPVQNAASIRWMVLKKQAEAIARPVGDLDVAKTLGKGIDDTVTETGFPKLCVTPAISGIGTEADLWYIVANQSQPGFSNTQAENDLAGCSLNATTPTPIMTCLPSWNMSGFDPDWLIDPETGDPIADEKRKRHYTRSLRPNPTYEQLEPRGTGKSRPFLIKCPSGQNFTINSHTYPNGDNGDYLYNLNPSAGFFILQDPADCNSILVGNNGGPPNLAGIIFITEHIVELGTLSLFLSYLMFGITTAPWAITRTSFPLIPETLLSAGSFFQRPWNQWDPDNPSTTTPIDDIWTAFGDNSNPWVLANYESVANGVKMLMWQGKRPMADATWTNNGFDGTSDDTGFFDATGGISTIRLATSTFSYLNNNIINRNMATILNAIYATFSQFDATVLRVTGGTINTAPMFAEFIYYGLIPTLEAEQEWALDRINRMITNWEAVQAAPGSSRQTGDAGEVLDELNALKEKVQQAVLVDTSYFAFPPPAPPNRLALIKRSIKDFVGRYIF